MVQGGMTCVKYLMFIFNFVFVVCGLALVIIGSIAQYNGNYYTDFLNGKYVTAPILVIILGVVIFFIAFLGCWGAMRENHCMVATFGVLMFIIFVVEIAAGITAYVYRNELETVLESGMNKTFAKHRFDKDNRYEKLWFDMEQELHCCGVHGPDDYKNGTIAPELPKSCCDKSKDICPLESAYKQGCFPKLLDFLQQKIAIVGGFGLGVAAIEVFGMIFAWCLATAIKKEYEGV